MPAGSVWSGLAEFLARYGLAVVFLVVLVKAAGIPLPIPGDLLLVTVGVLADRGELPFLISWLCLTTATAAGASALYTFSQRAGRQQVVRYGRHVGLTQARVTAAEQRLSHGGRKAIVLGRLIPGVRLVTVVACGVANIPRRVFLPALALASAVWVGVCMAIGLGLAVGLARMSLAAP